MIYKVGDQVLIAIEIQKSGTKRLLLRDPLEDSKVEEKYFPIVAVSDKDNTYKIIIDDDIRGWYINKFHIEHEKVDSKYFGKKFYDIPDILILSKK